MLTKMIFDNLNIFNLFKINALQNCWKKGKKAGCEM
jgi:hypothetical protein